MDDQLQMSKQTVGVPKQLDMKSSTDARCGAKVLNKIFPTHSMQVLPSHRPRPLVVKSVKDRDSLSSAKTG